jgi:glycogen debranching enzyme
MQTFSRLYRSRIALCLVLFLISSLALVAQPTNPPLELSRPVRTWEFLPVVGQRAALLGNETGNLEAWVYPLKLFRNFHLNFLLANQTLPAESLARTVIVRPESSTIVYSHDTFSVRETLFVPVHEPGAILTFEVTTTEPVEIEVAFERDFQLEWPAALGGTYLNWDARLHAFSLGEERKAYVALVGSPSASVARQEYSTNYSSSRENAFQLGVTAKGAETKLVAIAASSRGAKEAESTYQNLIDNHAQSLSESAKYYSDYLKQTVRVELPDKELQEAYDWSRISMLQGVVSNPDLGTGLIAGYRTAEDGQRPGFAWYFGRDSMWTSLALTASGDFATSRAALEFIGKYQRSDGKIPHEISQTANLVSWFANYPYAYASADATPLFIIAADDYVTRSGDTSFLHEKWDSLWKAYQFLRSTYDERGFPKNFAIGHGWIEGGPLLPIKAELYQVGLGTAALRSLLHLASLVGKTDESTQLNQAFTQQKGLLNELFWSEEKGLFAYAIGTNDQRLDIPSVLSTVPMWFDLLDQGKAQRMVDLLASPDHQTDWGMRMVSASDPHYSPGGYHFGSVWPLFTGWASVGEYRYHRAFPAYFNLRSNALLALNGSLGHVTEVLSGDFHQALSTSSPHQIWSAAMVVSPILRGLLGIEIDTSANSLKFHPHVPADWSSFAVQGLSVGNAKLDVFYRKTADELILEVKHMGSEDCMVEFAPAISPRAQVLRAEIDGRVVSTKLEQSDLDQHVAVHFSVNRPTTTLRIKTRNDFGLDLNSELPSLGATSHGLRVISESWNTQRDMLTLNLAGISGKEYELAVWNPNEIATVEGAELLQSEEKMGLVIRFPLKDSPVYVPHQVVVHFKRRR